MKQPIKILHVDLDWKVIYILVRPGSLIKSGISLETALDLLKNETFDLIISEPHHRAALHRQAANGNGGDRFDSIGNALFL